MSAGLPYLQKLRKSDLTEIAETSNLTHYSGLRKAELEERLDAHLRNNQTIYADEPSFSEYYRRLGTSARSPVKRIAEKVSDLVKYDHDTSESGGTAAPARKQRRRTRVTTDDDEDNDTIEVDTNPRPPAAPVKTPAKPAPAKPTPAKSTSTRPTPARQTPARTSARTATKTPVDEGRRSSLLGSSLPLPPSPAVVTDAIEAQTKRFRSSVSHVYDRTHVHEYSEAARETLSSSVTINLLAIFLEAYGLQVQILPKKLLAAIPPIPYVKSTSTPIHVSDLFMLLSQSFWAPFSLWLLTTIILPATISYFVNLPLRQLSSHSVAVRKTSLRANPRAQFDPFIFNLSKGLIAYVVFGLQVPLLDLFYQNQTVAVVNAAFPGGYSGALIGSGLGAAVSLYEAVLSK